MLPNVVILALGGTIAGVGAKRSDTSKYTPGKLAIESIANEIPELSEQANITFKQLHNKGSPDLTFADLIELAREVHEADKNGAIGVVIPVGTDNLEEVAFFLQCVVESYLNIALVGATRPDTAEGRDGRHNLLCSVNLVVDRHARRRGVMIVHNDSIFSAWDAVKLHANSTNAFGSGKRGDLGCFLNSRPHFYRTACRAMNERKFDFNKLFGQVRMSPKVMILYGHMDASPELIEAAVNAGVDGLILAGMGAGSWPTKGGEAIKHINRRRTKKIIFIASRQPEGYVEDNIFGLSRDCIAGGSLDPKRSCILLNLCIYAGYGQRSTEKVFDPEHIGRGPDCAEICTCSRKEGYVSRVKSRL